MSPRSRPVDGDLAIASIPAISRSARPYSPTPVTWHNAWGLIGWHPAAEPDDQAVQPPGQVLAIGVAHRMSPHGRPRRPAAGTHELDETARHAQLGLGPGSGADLGSPDMYQVRDDVHTAALEDKGISGADLFHPGLAP